MRSLSVGVRAFLRTIPMDWHHFRYQRHTRAANRHMARMSAWADAAQTVLDKDTLMTNGER